MKKYKLIKEYPGSPKLGTIVSFYDSQQSYAYLDRTVTTRFISSSLIEKNPEFWEEIIEKDYEILDFKSNVSFKDGHIVHYKQNNFEKRLEAYLKDPEWQIRSIRRLYDGEVFTVGDTVVFLADKPHMNCTSTIGSFRLENDEIKVLNEGCLISSLRNIQHVRKPLFTTEDGVDIYENDKHYRVGENLTLFIGHGKRFITADLENDNKRFSTKEAAEEYILLNKPCLSIKDVQSLFSTAKEGFIRFEKLKNLVKSKL